MQNAADREPGWDPGCAHERATVQNVDLSIFSTGTPLHARCQMLKQNEIHPNTL